ncbi:folylpolyglutamate synthase/dihydrofolate synthase family protein [soil metagenome]
MDFSHSVEYLLSLGNEVSAMKLGLDNIRTLLAELGNPHEKYLKVQVAGTNGKGSVCAFLDSICNEAGISTGTYTSPHLVSITERVRINGDDIAEDEFARFANVVRETVESLVAEGKLAYTPTFFEQVTAIALLAFAEHNVELAILETGLGGRLDAITATNSQIAAITRIDLDHQEYLGNTIEEIAAEKAAIIRAGSKVVIGSQIESAMKVILDRCANAGVVPLTVCESSVSAVDLSKNSSVVEFRTTRGVYWDSSLGLAGRHQVENACVAVLLAETLALDFEFPITEENIWIGLEEATHPGRLEYIGNRYLLDGAHNPSGTKALRSYLGEFENSRGVVMVFGAMEGKDVSEMLAALARSADTLIITRPGNSRAMMPEDIDKMMPGDADWNHVFIEASVKEALDKAETLTLPDGLILVTGSLYLVGEVKKLLNNR